VLPHFCAHLPYAALALGPALVEDDGQCSTNARAGTCGTLAFSLRAFGRLQDAWRYPFPLRPSPLSAIVSHPLTMQEPSDHASWTGCKISAVGGEMSGNSEIWNREVEVGRLEVHGFETGLER